MTRQATATEDPAERLKLFEALGDMSLRMLDDEERAGTCYAAAVASAQPLEAKHLPLLEKLLERQDPAGDLARLGAHRRADGRVRRSHGQPFATSVVGLDEDADRPAAIRRGQHPRGRPDAALELVADHARAAAHVALGDGTCCRGIECREYVLRVDVLAIHVAEPPVVRLAHDRQ